MKEKKLAKAEIIRPQNEKAYHSLEKAYKVLMENRQKRSVQLKK